MTPSWRRLGNIAVLAAVMLGLFVMPAGAKEIDMGGRTEEKAPETEPGEAEEPAEPEESARETEPEKAAEEPRVIVVGTAEALTTEEILRKIDEDMLIKRERDAFLTEHYTKAGISLFDELNYDAAKAEFERALKYDPNNREAKEYLRKTEAILGLQEARFANIIDQLSVTKHVEIELARHEMKLAFEKAEELMKEENFKEAAERFERVREFVKWIEPYFNEDELEPYKSVTEERIKTARAAQSAKEKRETELKRRMAEEAARMHAEHLRDLADQRLEVLLAKGRDFLAEARYAQAQSLAERILELDPMNGEAQALRAIAVKAGLAGTTKATDQTMTEETLLTWANVRDSAIPHTPLMIYPDNWPEIVKRQVQTIGAEPEAEPPWMDDLRSKLERKVSFDFVETPLRDVVPFLQTITNATIILDDDALADLPNSDVTLKVTDMKLNQALDWILSLVGLKYALMNEAIFISTEDKVGGEPLLKLYDVTDVILEIRDFPGNLQLLRDRIGTSSGSSTEIGAEDGGLWGLEEKETTGTFTGESLVEFIKSTIAPNSWDEGI